MEEVYAIVYPVAGMSSRFGGPKWFAEVGPEGESLIEYSTNQAIAAGFNRVVFIVSDNTEKIVREKFGLNYRGASVFYTSQKFDSKYRDKPWGTTDALCTTKNIINSPFVFCNGDDIYGEGAFRALIDHLKKEPGKAGTLGYNLVSTLPDDGGCNRAIFHLSEDSHVTDIKETLGIEKNDLEKHGLEGDEACSLNIFALHPEVLDELDKLLEQFKEENKGSRTAECLLPTEMANLIKQDKVKMVCHSTNEPWYGITNPGDEKIVREQLKKMKDKGIEVF
jgi:choline kinase